MARDATARPAGAPSSERLSARRTSTSRGARPIFRATGPSGGTSDRRAPRHCLPAVLDTGTAPGQPRSAKGTSRPSGPARGARSAQPRQAWTRRRGPGARPVRVPPHGPRVPLACPTRCRPRLSQRQRGRSGGHQAPAGDRAVPAAPRPAASQSWRKSALHCTPRAARVAGHAPPGRGAAGARPGGSETIRHKSESARRSGMPRRRAHRSRGRRNGPDRFPQFQRRARTPSRARAGRCTAGPGGSLTNRQAG